MTLFPIVDAQIKSRRILSMWMISDICGDKDDADAVRVDIGDLESGSTVAGRNLNVDRSFWSLP